MHDATAAPWIACTVVDSFLDHTALHVLLAALRAAVSGVAQRPLSLDRYSRFVEAALRRVVAEGLVGLDWGGSNDNGGDAAALALTLELRQIDPADGAVWSPVRSSGPVGLRFLLALYDGPLAAVDAAIMLGCEGSTTAQRLALRVNRAVFTTQDVALRIPSLRPVLEGSDQDIFILSGSS